MKIEWWVDFLLFFIILWLGRVDVFGYVLMLSFDWCRCFFDAVLYRFMQSDNPYF